MKKIFVILFLTVSIYSIGQKLTWSFDLSTMVTDTTIVFSYDKNAPFCFDFVASGLTGTSGTIDVLTGNRDTTCKSIDATNLPATVTAASFTSIPIWSRSGVGSVYLGFTITKGTLTAGTMEVLFNYNN